MNRTEPRPPVVEMLLAVILPPVGLCAGVWLLAKNRVGPALAVFLLAGCAMVVWSFLLQRVVA